MSVWSASLSQRFDERADDIPGPGAYDANYENHHVSNTSSSGFRTTAERFASKGAPSPQSHAHIPNSSYTAQDTVKIHAVIVYLNFE